VIQRAVSRDAIPDEVVRRITSAITPWRIVLFGSRARGSAKAHSDYDFYVEIDADRDALRGFDDQIREL
jgi:predicted nucleotidyltransferase